MNDIAHSVDLASVHKSGAIVSVDRLAWLNKQHLRAGLALMESGDAVNSLLHANTERLLMDAYGLNLSRADAAAAISLACDLDLMWNLMLFLSRADPPNHSDIFY